MKQIKVMVGIGFTYAHCSKRSEIELARGGKESKYNVGV